MIFNVAPLRWEQFEIHGIRWIIKSHIMQSPTGSVGIQWALFAHSESGPLCFGCHPHLVVPVTVSTQRLKRMRDKSISQRGKQPSVSDSRASLAHAVDPRNWLEENRWEAFCGSSCDNGQLVHNNLAGRKNKKDRCLPEKCRLYFRSRNCVHHYHTSRQQAGRAISLPFHLQRQVP